ncbi:MAG: J domain-containing protein [Candidatus Aenigmarchaeota archaeon]|nr:J domain-containing protein [Candidatus Aenigmarchaeota archaeon]
MVRIKGHEINPVITKLAYNRKALQFKNNIISTLKSIGVDEYDVKIPLESVAIRNVKAQATWWLDGYRMHYSYNQQNKFVDNLWIIYKVIELETKLLISKEHTLTEFCAAFKEDKDIDKQRQKAREHIGVAHDETNIETINQKYKEMARTLHPDMPTGDVEKFKKLNNAHKILKRELS